MGNRLVCVIYDKSDKPLAASYQHWSADDYKLMDNIIEKRINDWKWKHFNHSFDKEDAIYVLRDSCKEFNGTDDPICIELEHYNWSKDDKIPFSSDEEKKFAVLHPDIDSNWDKANRSNGILCINEEKIKDWIDWAEAINEYRC